MAPELSPEGQGTQAPALKEFLGQFIPSTCLVGLCCVCVEGGGSGGGQPGGEIGPQTHTEGQRRALFLL